ncbi:MAG: calcium-binding protein, partial [Acidimicrobiales bacterium]
DVAMLHLPGQSAITPMALSTNTAFTEPIAKTDTLPARFYGFGLNDCPPSCANADGRLRRGESSIYRDDRAAELALLNPEELVSNIFLVPDLNTQGGGCFGDSGGPVTVLEGGQYRLVGVSSFISSKTDGLCDGFPDGSGGVVLLHAVTDLVSTNLGDWIRSIAGAVETCNGQPVDITGSGQGDILVGTSATNVMHGRGGDDFLVGRGGNDVLCGGNSSDVLFGNSGDDVLRGGNGSDILFGNSGNDTIRGGGGSDTIGGGWGNDTIRGGGGSDDIRGGIGVDVIRGGTADDTIRGGGGSDILKGGPGRDTLRGGNGDDTVRGGPGDDDIRGNRGADTLKGKSGDDVLKGGSGDDAIDGGSGTDTCSGGSGTDTLTNC